MSTRRNLRKNQQKKRVNLHQDYNLKPTPKIQIIKEKEDEINEKSKVLSK